MAASDMEASGDGSAWGRAPAQPALEKVYSPQLQRISSGKVRESFRVSDELRLLVVTDRISAFDHALETPIPRKGEVLGAISNWWFEQTADIVPNHLVRALSPRASLVREAKPFSIEVIVRGYLTGSMWRGYKAGERVFSGVELGEGRGENERFEVPLVTPTTKDVSDSPITPAEIVKSGRMDEAMWKRVDAVARALFDRGTQILAEKGIILVDTKYEFGLVDGELTLIDEIHTPDSSRFWSAEDWAQDPTSCRQHDKEFVRQWLLANAVDGEVPRRLPPEVIEETTRRYLDLYEQITGAALPPAPRDARRALLDALVDAELVLPGFVAIVMGSTSDLPFARGMAEKVREYGIFADLRIASAHKNGDVVAAIAEDYDRALEPGAVIAVAGRSNGLGGALAANLALPVFNCPPFKDKLDMLVNINSSLVMPSRTPAATVIDPGNAVGAAVRALNLPALRDRLREEIAQGREALQRADRELREEGR